MGRHWNGGTAGRRSSCSRPTIRRRYVTTMRLSHTLRPWAGSGRKLGNSRWRQCGEAHSEPKRAAETYQQRPPAYVDDPVIT